MFTANEILSMFESIGMKDINKWEKDAKSFSKDILWIKNGKQYAKVGFAFRIWQKNFDSFVFKKLLGISLHNYSKEDESYYESNIRKKVWAFITNNPFFDAGMINDGEGGWFDSGTLSKRDGKGTPIFKGNEDKWELIYDSWSRKRKTEYRRYNRLKREAFGALKEYFEYFSKKKFRDLFVTRSINVSGIPVKIDSLEDDKSQEKVIKDHILAIKKLASIMKKKGVDKVLSGLKINIDLQTRGSQVNGLRSDLVGGYYDRDSDNLTIMAFGNDLGTLIHELGHRYYFKFMSKEQREHWTSFIDGNMVGFDGNDLVEFEKAIWDCYKDLEKLENWVYPPDIWKHIDKYIKSDYLKMRYNIIKSQKLGGLGFYSFDDDKGGNLKTVETYVRRFKEKWKDDKLMIDTISDYANTNEMEAWSELFRKFVLGDKNIPLVPLILFKKIVLGVM